MATLGVILGGAIANAVAFTGGQAIYRAVEPGSDPEKERERHDKAVEALNKATVEWSRKRQETMDFINRKMRKEGRSEQDFEDVDRALSLYNRTREPTLADFYQPSPPQKQYEYAFIIGSIAATGYLAYRFL